jgi:ketosteroid isomerase-like protein
MMNADPLREAIQKRNTVLLESYRCRDIESVAAVYAADARLLPPNAPAAHGRAAIRQFWQTALDSGVREPRLKTDDVLQSGELVREVGTGELTIDTADGQATTLTINYVVVWTRGPGGEWEIDTDIWNSPS